MRHKIGQSQPSVIIYIYVQEIDPRCYIRSFKAIGPVILEKDDF